MPKENSLKKITEADFSNLVSYLLYAYMLYEVYRKIMSEIHFVGKTRYEDLTRRLPFNTKMNNAHLSVGECTKIKRNANARF